MNKDNLVNNNVSALNGESDGMTSNSLVKTNLTRKQPYSSYSFNLDPADSDYIRVPDPGDIFAYGESVFSFSGWINVDSYSDQDGIFGRFYSGAERATIKFGFSPFNSVMFQAVKNNANAYVIWNGILNVGWQHICLTYDAGNVKVYLNGLDQGLPDVVVGTIPDTMPNLNSWNSQLEIGRDAMNSAQRLMNGKVSNFCIFNKVLEPGDIVKIYNNGVAQDLKNEPLFYGDILAWWPMDENSSYYDGTDWGVRDLIGGKDGLGINTGNVNDMVGDAPGSQANGLGTNLTIGDLKSNMKDSKHNAYSINMADYADGVTNPADSGRSTEIPTVP